MPRGDGTILDPNVHEAFIRNYAAQRGLDPDFIARLATAEGLNAWSAANPSAGSGVDVQSGKPFSFGDFQLNVRDGLGNVARQHGIDPANPNQWQQADKFAIDYIAQTRDLRPWAGDSVAAAYLRTHPAGNPGAFNPAAAASGVAQQGPASPAAAPNITDISNQSNYRGGQLGNVQGFIWHHTGGGSNVQSIVNTLNQRNLGTQYIMDRDGSVYRFLPSGTQGAHILPSTINDLSNANTEGMEVIAQNDKDITPQQVASARRFAAWYSAQHPGVQYFGHGEVNPGHKEATEGATITNAIRQDQANGTTPPPGGSAPPAGTAVAGGAATGGTAGAGSALQPPPPLTLGQRLGMIVGQGLIGMGSGGGGAIQDPPPDMPIRTPALQGFQMVPQPDYLGQSSASGNIGSIGGSSGMDFGGGGITAGAPSMTSMAVGTGIPMTGVGAESPLTFATAQSRYSRTG